MVAVDFTGNPLISYNLMSYKGLDDWLTRCSINSQFNDTEHITQHINSLGRKS